MRVVHDNSSLQQMVFRDITVKYLGLTKQLGDNGSKTPSFDSFIGRGFGEWVGKLSLNGTLEGVVALSKAFGNIRRNCSETQSSAKSVE
jgi:hypothetical protein